MRGSKNVAIVVTMLISFGMAQLALGQSNGQELFDILKEKDSLIFDASFETCNLKLLSELITDDFEFYHDQGGITTTKDAFLEDTKNGLCNLSYDARRELDLSSLQVFPLFNKGELYGAIQKGVHHFFAKEEGQPERETSVAKFTHLWILTDDKWKLKRVLSYDHRSP